MDELQRLRDEIDTLDQDLLSLIAKRVIIVKQIGAYKKAHDLAALSEDRKQAVLEAWQHQAKQLGLSEQTVQKLYEVIHDYAMEIETSQESP